MLRPRSRRPLGVNGAGVDSSNDDDRTDHNAASHHTGDVGDVPGAGSDFRNRRSLGSGRDARAGTDRDLSDRATGRPVPDRIRDDRAEQSDRDTRRRHRRGSIHRRDDPDGHRPISDQHPDDRVAVVHRRILLRRARRRVVRQRNQPERCRRTSEMVAYARSGDSYKEVARFSHGVGDSTLVLGPFSASRSLAWPIRSCRMSESTVSRAEPPWTSIN